MMLSLTSAGNPDHGQDPTETLFGCEPGKLIKIETFKEASERCRKFIDDNNLGSGNWIGGAIYEGNEQIAKVSYNGRVWKSLAERQEIEI